ncbi:alpha/beta fold hydrolase [Merismopedia glauca]|uniref:Alpha/beta hydrolase n=2 Tax=Merismopedia TaxID=53402 RepID=A0A2T1C8M6_9CYAN|nr:alpha/beta hydrolase [Merismopedia glauca CCAP 1448/3]
MVSPPVISSQPLPGTYWQWQGESIYYVKGGNPNSSCPPLLLVHGFGASTDHWRKNISGLASEFEVYAIDLLGFGRSAKPKRQYSGDLWREQIHDFITQVIKKPVILAGNSLGGYVSLGVAAQHPESASGLILLNSAGPFTDLVSSSPALEPNGLQKLLGNGVKWIWQQPLAKFLIFQYVSQPWVIRQTLEKVYLDKSAVTEQLIEEIRRPACDVGALDVFSSVFSTPQGEKVDVLLSQLNCPLLLLWGEGDPWINAKNRSVQFRQHYPQLTEYFLQAGHCPHDEVPDRVNDLIGEWVKANTSTSHQEYH